MCTESGCLRRAVSRDLCRMHYQRLMRHGSTAPPPTRWESFWAHVVDETNGCRVWAGARGHDGYGVLKVAGKAVRATRYVWEHEFGPIPAGLSVLHACDNPPCVRPDHLMLGTQQANVTDAIRKGRRGKAA